MNEPPGSGVGCADQGAAQARDLLRAVIDNLPDSIFAKDNNGHFIMANETVARIMSLASPEKVVGHTDEELVEVGRADQYREIDRRVIEHGEAVLNHEETRLGVDG